MEYIYDIEVYPNLFLFCSYSIKNKTRQTFEISSFKDDRIEFASFLSQSDLILIGFNNLGYDYPVIHYLITKVYNCDINKLNGTIKAYSDKIIHSKAPYISPNDFICKQIDLFKINHFDNVAKSVSLKELEFNFRMTNIQELPYDVNSVLNREQIDNVITYCHNDVETTYKLYVHTLPEIELREKMTNIYNVDFTNYNSTKIGETILIKNVEKALGYDAVYETIETSNRIIRVPRQSPITEIKLSDVILPSIVFTEDCFNALLNFFKSKSIRELNGAFTRLPLSEIEPLKAFCEEEIVNVKDENGNKVQLQKTLNIHYKGLTYYYGVGGIHACVEPGIYTSDDEYVIVDLDVASFYPNLSIKNRFYPEHYGEPFCDVYEGIYDERKNYPKKTAENLTYKLALNGAYGKSNSPHSPLYSPKFTVSITLNGQLSLTMLIERVMEEIQDAQCLQANTDGATFRIKRKYLTQLNEIKQRWENYTQLLLEEVEYEKMIISNVSNYIAVSDTGKIKRKGTLFIYKEVPGELEIYKNYSNLSAPKGLEAYFINNIKPEVFIDNLIEENIYDFFLRSKIKKQHSIVSRSVDEVLNTTHQEEIQRISRYIVTGEIIYDKKTKTYSFNGVGNQLIKLMPPLKGKENNREEELEKGYLCTVVNDISNIDINYLKSIVYKPYYLNQICKIIESING